MTEKTPLEAKPRVAPLTLAEAHARWRPLTLGRQYPADLDAAQVAAIDWLIRCGEERLGQAKIGSDFETGDPAAESYLNNIAEFPHLFVLGCVMDRQIPTSRAWRIPTTVGEALGGMSFTHFSSCDAQHLGEIFASGRLHRFPGKMAAYFYGAIRLITERYEGDAGRIWAPGSSSAGVIRRLLEFDGIGLKIANMAVNILARDFRVLLTEYSSIDIAPDSRVAEFFKHHRMLRTKKREEIIYLARELYPWYPGMLDIGAWEWQNPASRSRRS